MKVLISPNAMKGSLDAFRFANAVADGINQEGFTDNVLLPIADGGDGSAEIIARFMQASYIRCEVLDPLSRKVQSGFYLTSNAIAIVEMASASGLRLIKPIEYNALIASSFGTGQLIKEAISQGAKSILLCVGGSATTDAGMGALIALGCKFFTSSEEIITGNGQTMGSVISVEMNGMNQLLKEVEITVIVDVLNPLLGKTGCVSVFSSQKGADDRQLKILERNIAQFAGVLFQTSGIDISNVKGGGAAGGIASTLHALAGAKIVSGTEYILDLLKFKEVALQCNVIVTGEGKIDEQTFFGKAISGILKIGSVIEKPVYVICGVNQLNSIAPFKDVLELVDSETTVNDAMANAYNLITQRASALAKKWKENGNNAE